MKNEEEKIDGRETKGIQKYRERSKYSREIQRNGRIYQIEWYVLHANIANKHFADFYTMVWKGYKL